MMDGQIVRREELEDLRRTVHRWRAVSVLLAVVVAVGLKGAWWAPAESAAPPACKNPVMNCVDGVLSFKNGATELSISASGILWRHAGHLAMLLEPGGLSFETPQGAGLTLRVGTGGARVSAFSARAPQLSWLMLDAGAKGAEVSVHSTGQPPAHLPARANP